jgi:hypothetical protein
VSPSPSFSPSLMNMNLDQPLVKGGDRGLCRCVDRRKRAGGSVRLRLRGVAGTGDDGGDGVLLEDPAERELGHRYIGRHECTQLVDRFEGRFERHAGEGLTDIEGLAVAVEVAVVVGCKDRVPADLARKQAGGERNANNDADIPLLGLGEEKLLRPLAEDVVDDLDRGDARISTETP